MTQPRERPLIERGWRYTLVGLVCAAANYVVMLVIDAFGGQYVFGTIAAFLAVTPLGYALHSRFTFGEPLKVAALGRFAIAAASAFPVSLTVMIILCSELHLSVAVAVPIMTGFMFGWNFASAHWAILPRFDLVPVILARAAVTKGRSRRV
jgi:putative flippase GtrA